MTRFEWKNITPYFLPRAAMLQKRDKVSYYRTTFLYPPSAGTMLIPLCGLCRR